MREGRQCPRKGPEQRRSGRLLAFSCDLYVRNGHSLRHPWRPIMQQCLHIGPDIRVFWAYAKINQLIGIIPYVKEHRGQSAFTVNEFLVMGGYHEHPGVLGATFSPALAGWLEQSYSLIAWLCGSRCSRFSKYGIKERPSTICEGNSHPAAWVIVAVTSIASTRFRHTTPRVPPVDSRGSWMINGTLTAGV